MRQRYNKKCTYASKRTYFFEKIDLSINWVSTNVLGGSLLTREYIGTNSMKGEAVFQKKYVSC